MRERGYWDDFADGMALTIEGERLIVGEIAACIREEAGSAMRWIAEQTRGLGWIWHPLRGQR